MHVDHVYWIAKTSPGRFGVLILLMRRIELRCGYVQRRWLAVDASVPDASAEGCDVDGILVGWIRNHAMGPLEIESRNAGPVFAAIHRTPRRGFKASSVQPIRIPWVNSDVIN